MKKWKEDWEKIHKESFKKYLQERDILISEKKKEKGLEIDSVMLENLEEETSRNWEIYYKRDKEF